MSLINEALKKAQRQRNEEPAEAVAATPAAGVRIAKRSKATSANTMVLVGSGALVLIVLSVVITVYLLNRPVAGPARNTAAVTHPMTPPAAETPAPVVVAPLLVHPVSPAPTETVPLTAPVASPAASGPGPTPAGGEPAPAGTPPPAAAAPVVPAAKPAPVPVAPVPDERVAAFVEAIRVTGIRSSGTESRVLMNERVYRVNDLVDRALNLRLIKVAADSLTFSDGNGITYVKNF